MLQLVTKKAGLSENALSWMLKSDFAFLDHQIDSQRVKIRIGRQNEAPLNLLPTSGMLCDYSQSMNMNNEEKGPTREPFPDPLGRGYMSILMTGEKHSCSKSAARTSTRSK